MLYNHDEDDDDDDDDDDEGIFLETINDERLISSFVLFIRYDGM